MQKRWSTLELLIVFIANEVVEPTRIARLVELRGKAGVKVAVDDLINAEQIAKTATS
jgi:hypothetical protein